MPLDLSGFDATVGRTPGAATSPQTQPRTGPEPYPRVGREPSTQLDLSGFDAAPAPAGGLDLSGFDSTPSTESEHLKADVDRLAASGNQAGMGVVEDSDLAEIGRVHGVEPEYLRDWVGWLAGVSDPRSRRGAGDDLAEMAKSTIGAVTSAIPAQLVKKWGVEDESKRRALDDLSELIDKRQSVGTKVSHALAGAALPALGSATNLVRGASTAVRLGVGAAEAAGAGAAYGYAGSSEDNELESTAFGAAIGLGLGGAVAGVSRGLAARAARRVPALEREVAEVAEDATAKARAAYAAAEESERALEQVVLHTPEVREAARKRDVVQFLDSTTPESRATLAKLADPSAKLDVRQVRAYGEDSARAWQVVRSTTHEFDVRAGVGVRRGGVRDVVEQEGAAHIAAKYRGMREATYLRKQLSELTPEQAGRPGFLGKTAGWFADLRYTTDAIDGRLGTRITPVVDRLSAAYNQFTDEMAQVSQLQRGLNRMLLRAEAKPTLDGKKFDLYAELEASSGLPAGTGPATSRLRPEQEQTVAAWRAGFESLRERAGELGVPVRKLAEGVEGYVPHRAVDAVQYIQRMDEAGSRLGVQLDDEASQLRVLAAAESGEGAAAEYIQGLRLVRGGDAVTTPSDIRAALREMEDVGRTGHRLETVAGASLEREAERGIPTWLRETDVPLLFQRWAHSTYRHARLRGHLDELRSTADAIRDVNPEASGYIERFVEDLVGVRSGSAAASQGEWLTRFQVQASRRARAAGEGTAASYFWKSAGRLPDLLPALQAQVYPYALGLRADKLIQNLISPLVLGLPTIGVRNVGYIIRGVGDLVRAGPKQMRRLLSQEGLAPRDQPLEAHRWLAEGLERSPYRRTGQKALDGFNRFAMHLYTQTDLVTRSVTYFAAKRLADDMQRGVPAALDVIREMGPGYQAGLRESLARGEDVSRDVAAWLNGYTQFNYNRASMSEYGRFMGSLFSTFSKWPTSISGNLAAAVDRGMRGQKMSPELIKLGWKFLGPWLAMQAVERGFLQSVKEDNPEVEMLTGKSLVSAAPLSSVTSLIGGDLAGPIPRAVSEVGKAAASNDPETAGPVLLRNMAPFIPIIGTILRFMYHDLPIYSGSQQKSRAPTVELMQDLGILDEN